MVPFRDRIHVPTLSSSNIIMSVRKSIRFAWLANNPSSNRSTRKFAPLAKDHTTAQSGLGSSLLTRLGRLVIGSSLSPTYASRRPSVVLTDQVLRL